MTDDEAINAVADLLSVISSIHPTVQDRVLYLARVGAKWAAFDAYEKRILGNPSKGFSIKAQG